MKHPFKSRGWWGAVILALAILLPMVARWFGLDVDSEAVREDATVWVDVVQQWMAAVGAFLSVVGVRGARTPLAPSLLAGGGS